MEQNEKILQYKGYTGIYSYRQEDRCYFGKITGIKDLITFEAYKEDNIYHFFQEAVDDYLEILKQKGFNIESKKHKPMRYFFVTVKTEGVLSYQNKTFNIPFVCENFVSLAEINAKIATYASIILPEPNTHIQFNVTYMYEFKDILDFMAFFGFKLVEEIDNYNPLKFVPFSYVKLDNNL